MFSAVLNFQLNSIAFRCRLKNLHNQSFNKNLRKIPMEIDVYDTFASSKKGNTIHFDVLLPSGGKKEDASIYARLFLEKIGESAEALDSCKFCHSEKADVEVEKQIQSDGYYIVRIEGCPDE